MNVHVNSLNAVSADLLLELGKAAVWADLVDGTYRLIGHPLTINEQHLILAGALVWEGSFNYERFLTILQKIH